METWKQIPDMPNYEVSDQGRIRSNKTKKVMRSSITNWGYCRVTVSIGGKSKLLLVHRAVAKAFIPNPDPATKIQVNHIDCDKTNNKVENLEWVTPVENMAHAYAHDLVPSALARPVLMTEKNYTVVQEFPSATVASVEISGSKSAQGNITRSAQSCGQSTALGHRWFYADDPFNFDQH